MSTAKAFLILPGYMASWPQAGQAPVTPEQVSGLMPDFLQSQGQWSHEEQQLPWQSQLCQLLGLKEQQGNRLPTFAAVEPSGIETETIDDPSTWVYADPVHLEADRDTATLIPSELLSIDDDSADALINTLNDFYANDGIRFHRQVAGHWFISGQPAKSLAAYPTSFLAHRNASAFLPEDDEAGTWRRLMTEIQMLLHTHPVNEKRERCGLMTINSLWFWGGVPVEDLLSQERRVRVFADDPFALALCEKLQIERLTLADATSDNARSLQDVMPLQDKESVQDFIVVDTRLINALLRSDIDAIASLTQQINVQLVQPLSNLVLNGQLAEVHVQTEDGLLGSFSLESMPRQKLQTRLRRWWQHLSGKWK